MPGLALAAAEDGLAYTEEIAAADVCLLTVTGNSRFVLLPVLVSPGAWTAETRHQQSDALKSGQVSDGNADFAESISIVTHSNPPPPPSPRVIKLLCSSLRQTTGAWLPTCPPR